MDVSFHSKDDDTCIIIRMYLSTNVRTYNPLDDDDKGNAKGQWILIDGCFWFGIWYYHRYYYDMKNQSTHVALSTVQSLQQRTTGYYGTAAYVPRR